MSALIHLSRKKAAKHPNVRWDGLNEFLAFGDFAELSPTQKVAYLAYWYSSQIEMSGHHGFFSTPPSADFSEVASALRAIGATEQASILTTALDAVHVASARAPDEYSNRFTAGLEFADLSE